ncbi:hypothetical protein YC2023_009201 [Brassica napus]
MKNLIHLVLHAIALALGIWGIYAVSKNHYKSGIPDLIASIPGLVLVSFRSMPSIFIVFFFPGGSPNLRSGLLPCHVMLGLFIDDIAMAGRRKRLRNLASRNSYGSTFLGQPDSSASTSGTSSDFFDEINLNA